MNCGAGRFGAPVVVGIHTPHTSVLLVFKLEHAMNNGHVMLNLDLSQRVCHTPGHMLGMAGLTLKNDTQADDRRRRLT